MNGPCRFGYGRDPKAQDPKANVKNKLAVGLLRNVAMNPAIDELGAEEIWKEPVDRVLARLVTTSAGLETTEVQSRLKTFGCE